MSGTVLGSRYTLEKKTVKNAMLKELMILGNESLCLSGTHTSKLKERERFLQWL